MSVTFRISVPLLDGVVLVGDLSKRWKRARPGACGLLGVLRCSGKEGVHEVCTVVFPASA